ncbi:MAG: DUF115 domain-containing protein [Spirochaetes bacterium]|nr:DUF115 domain-containing protein [Spirochaetota bacterium]MBU0955588.1 DUF115 domain-containing protein [Spirochaetota bacterium]
MPVTDYTIFERNMLALCTGRNLPTAARIRNAQPSRTISFEPARSGMLVPQLQRNGRRYSIHSRFDPEAEGEKAAEGYPQRGFFIFLGLGAGYSITPFLNNNKLSRGIIIDFDAGMIRSLLETLDLTSILADRRLDFIVDPEPEELQELFISAYIPSLYGNLSVVPLRGRVDENSVIFQQASDHIRALMEGVSDDYSVQAFFGKRWFANIIRNLQQAAGSTPPIGPIQKAVVTAAGPSLELAINDLRNLPKDVFLIATDTSLSVLLGFGIQPSAVISIDCQHISYYHFMRGIPAGIPVFLDLASPPTVARLAGGSYFFSSGHPLARYVTARLRAYPILDTSGGNVTHAAVSLADFLGAQRIDLYGADFSYPAGKAYARGSYIYPYFDIRQSRLAPSEALFSHFLFRNKSMDHEMDCEGHVRFITKPLVAYRERLERLGQSCASRLVPHIGNGMPIQGSPPNQIRQDFGKVFAAGRLFRSTQEFLEEYRDDIAGLELPGSSAGLYLAGLKHKERDIWMTLLPAAAAIRRESGDPNPEPEAILETTRRWCLSKVQEALDSL